MIDFAGLAAALLLRARDLLPQWLPGGKMSGHEYVCGSLKGEEGRSLSINMNTGRWADFSGDQKGGDLISLWAAMEGIKQAEAAKDLAQQIGFGINREIAQRVAAHHGPPPEIKKPPKREPAPNAIHRVFNAPTARWCYRDAYGDPMFYMARYDPVGERKQYVPWTWDGERYVAKAPPDPRPIYGLDLLEERPSAPVLIVEGEKAADAARTIAGRIYVVVSWPGGSSAWQKVNWKPLNGRKVLLWPDADRHLPKTAAQAAEAGVDIDSPMPIEFQPGYKAMVGIAKILAGNAAEVKLINPGIDEERADGWDAFDALAGGWQFEQLKTWAAPRVVVMATDTTTAAAEIEAAVVKKPVGDEPDEEGALEVPTSLYALYEKLGIAVTASGNPIYNMDNARRVIEGKFPGMVWYDVFHKKIFTTFDFQTGKETARREWSEVDELHLTAFMQRFLGLRKMSSEMVRQAIAIHANLNQRNEPRDWMETLVWDGTPRINSFLVDCYGAEEGPYASAISRNFWIALAARVYDPGCQMDNMIVLEGIQGGYKTTSLKLIGGPWYTNVREAVTSKDFFMVLQGRLIIEIAELESFGKAEITKIKEVVTTSTDRFRSPYARTVQDHPRTSVFIGTTNEDQYLRDNTGARRFWPVKCSTIDKQKIIDDRDQLFAEAVAGFKRWQVSRDAADGWWNVPAQAAEEQEARRQRDVWEDYIDKFLDGKDRTTMEECAYVLKIDAAHLDIQTQRRISNCLRALQWNKKRGRHDGKLKYIWSRPGTAEEPELVEGRVQETAPF